jgi:CheY-like chemotaxis protein
MAAQLATGVMHDFNNMLTAMLGHASLLEIDMPHEDPLYQHVRYIVELTERASQLTRKILSYAGKQDLSPQIIDLRTIVKDLQPLIQPLLGANVHLTLRLTPGALPVEADQLQLEQMLMNLAVNARDAMPAGGNLTISTGSVTSLPGQDDRTAYRPSASYAHIAVSDTGEGISQDSLQRIYEPFFTTKGTGKGTGLGLSIVRDIVEHYGGLITCTSSPGRGTVFDLYLPLNARETGSGEPPIGIDLLEGSETILIAEDDPVVRHIAVQTMKKLGYSVIEAVDGDDARRKFALEGADVRCLVIDVVMAGSIGASVYKDISSEKPGIPVLFISGYTTDELRQRGISLEGHRLLMKPFSPQALINRVQRLIGKTGNCRPHP